MRDVDCAIVGGGPAGLSAAVNLCRMRRSVLVIDDRDGRSLWGQTNRNYLGFPNGIHAAEIRLAARKQAANYGARFLAGQVVAAERTDDLFILQVQARPGRSGRSAGRQSNVKRDLELGGSLGEDLCTDPEQIRARTLILATGVRDNFPAFPGWDECVGLSLFWCINCDGYESADRKVTVIGHDEEAIQTALELLDFTPSVSIVAGRAEGFSVPPERLEDLRANGVAIFDCAVAAFPNEAGQIQGLMLDDSPGTRLETELVFVNRRPSPRNEVALALGVEVNGLGHVIVDSEAHTSVPGFYAAGDVTNLHDHQISAAVHEGAEAAMAANYYLYRPVQREPGSKPR